MRSTLPIPRAEWSTDVAVATRLVRAQHPDLADLPVSPLGSGWDTEVHRLGTDLVVRLPRRALGAQLLAKELAWVPRLPPLSVPIPLPVRAGESDDGFPAVWSICRFVPGSAVGAGLPDGPVGERAATQLADFLRALHVAAPPDAPTSQFRGVPLGDRDAALRARLDVLPSADRAVIVHVWEEGLAARPHAGPPRWLHGDLHGLNVLCDGRGISGVVDFGDLCVGDPAGDLTCAWLVLGSSARAAFRRALVTDDEAWARGRAWAAYLAVMFLAHSAQDPRNAAIGTRGISEAIAG